MGGEVNANIAHLVVEGTGWVVEASECLLNSNPVAPLEVRHAAIREGWDEPEVITTIYLADCHRQSVDSSGCDQTAVQQRLVALNPENAFEREKANHQSLVLVPTALADARINLH